jgi:hypothetical protein
MKLSIQSIAALKVLVGADCTVCTFVSDGAAESAKAVDATCAFVSDGVTESAEAADATVVPRSDTINAIFAFGVMAIPYFRAIPFVRATRESKPPPNRVVPGTARSSGRTASLYGLRTPLSRRMD